MADGGITVMGDTASARRRLQGIAVQLADLRPFWPRLRLAFTDWQRQQFATEGAWGGARWAPLSGRYAARKARLHPGRSLLVATGAMRRAALAPAIENPGPRDVTFVIRDPKAAFHQHGTSLMTARPLIPEPLPAAAARDVRRLMADHVRSVLDRWGV